MFLINVASFSRSLVKFAACGVVGLGALISASGQAEAAPLTGCAAVNAGAFNQNLPNLGTIGTLVEGFGQGDRITFVFTSSDDNGGGNSQWWITVSGIFGPDRALSTGTFTQVYTVSAPGSTTIRQTVRTQNLTQRTASVSATCDPAPPPTPSGPTTTDSDRLSGVQTQGSTMAAQQSGAVITDSVSGATSDAFNNGGAPVTMGPGGMVFNFTADPKTRAEADPRNAEVLNALAYAGDARKAPHALPALIQPWSVWLNIRGSGFDRIRSSAAEANGTQINASFGVGYKINPNLLIGAFTGYENFTYNFTAVNGRLKGDGGTIGAYAGWKITEKLRWDVMAGWSGISYNASAGTASGVFTGSRWIASTGLTGTHRIAGFTLEPSAKVFMLWEHQKAWTDSLGALQTARDFTAGRVSAGGRVLTPSMSVAVFKVTPFVGLYTDWRFTTDNALPAAVDYTGLGKGWSGRVTGGVNIVSVGGGMLGLSGEYGGIGSDYGVWTANARVSWPL